MASRNEIVLFFVEDKAQEMAEALAFSETVNKSITPADMLRLCVASIRHHVPDAEIVLITDADSMIHASCPDVTVRRDEAITMDRLIYHRVRAYRDYLTEAVQQGREAQIVFMDIDILLNRNITDAFADTWDVAFTAGFDPNLRYSERGIPIGSQKTPVNGGVMFARTTEAALAFYTDWVAQIEQVKETDDFAEYEQFRDDVIRHYDQWWGAQHVLMLMLGKAIRDGQESMQYGAAEVRLFGLERYNFSPAYRAEGAQLHMDLRPEHLQEVYVFHMKGPRKMLLPKLAEIMKITAPA